MARITGIANQMIDFYEPINTWLDIGSGDGKVISELKWFDTVKEAHYIEAPNMPDLTYSNWNRLPSLADATGTYDLITMFDVIEHYTKKDGYQILKKIRTLGKHLILFTPESFFPQEGTAENPYMEHLSGWFIKDFENHGIYNVLRLEDFHYHENLKRHFNALLAWI